MKLNCQKHIKRSQKISSARKLSKSKIQIGIESAFKNLALKNSKIDFNLTESDEFNKNGINNIRYISQVNSHQVLNYFQNLHQGEKITNIICFKIYFI